MMILREGHIFSLLWFRVGVGGCGKFPTKMISSMGVGGGGQPFLS